MTQASIFFRPHAKETLQELSKHFEIIVFTASHRGYADKVVDLLDPTGTWVSHRLFREHCFRTKQGVYVKDLRVINRKLKDMLLVDNMVYSYAFQLENGVPIVPYYNYPEDRELLMLTEYLLALKDEDDLRIPNKAYFKYDCFEPPETPDTADACFERIFLPGKRGKTRGSSQARSGSAAPQEGSVRT